MNLIWATLTTVSILFQVHTALATPSQCKCTYGDPCWPTDAQFQALQSQISQPLIHPTPPESACYPSSDPSGNCTAATELAGDGDWRSDQPGSMEFINFETYTFPNGTLSACYLNSSLGFPCGQGSVSPIGVDARSVEDVQATINFAVQYNLRLVVKNTGHDYLGRSAARNSLLLWTHHFKNITLNASFVPQGAPSNESYQAITLGAGVQWHETYDAVEAQNLFVVGGACESVGSAGGWLAGGGHSAFSPKYGLGVDNVIEFQIVTSTGDFLTANSYQNQDLFWALRGGGGGTYGVVISATYRTWPSTPVIVANLQANFTDSDVAKEVLTEFVNTTVSLADAGWGGYAFLSSMSLQIQYVATNVSNNDATAAISPFFYFVGNKTSDVLTSTVPYDSNYAWYRSAEGTPVGVNTELSSRLLPRTVALQNAEGVVASLLSINDTVSWFQVAGGAVAGVNANSTGLNPAWRDAISHIRVGKTWPDGSSSADINQVQDQLKTILSILNSTAGPGSGAYWGEASLYETNPQQAFFGSHYGNLESVKNTYDPHQLFIVTDGVGSENWDESLTCMV